MNANEEARQILESCQALVTGGHFVYKSGQHGDAYVNKDAVYLHPVEISRLCCLMAYMFVDKGVNAVIGPVQGGIILSQWVASHLAALDTPDVLSVFADRSEDGQGFIIKRGYDKVLAGKRVLVVEDILTTGGSAKAVVEAVRAVGGEVVGVGAICNRGQVTVAQLGNVPALSALVEFNLTTYDFSECPLCRANVPVRTDLGKGREFLAAQAKK